MEYPILNVNTMRYYISEGKYGSIDEAIYFTWKDITENIMLKLDENHVVDVNNAR